MSTRKLRRKYRPSSHGNNISGKSRIVRRALTHRREIDHGKTWYAIRTNIGCGGRAAAGLRGAGFDVFRPVDDRWKVHKWRCSDVSTDWFGRYLFVGCAGICRFDTLRDTDGVEGILGIAGAPIAVRPEVLQAVADQIAGYRADPQHIAPSGVGDLVKVAVGTFAEFEGLIAELDHKKGRAKVKLSLFGKQFLQELDFVDLKAA